MFSVCASGFSALLLELCTLIFVLGVLLTSRLQEQKSKNKDQSSRSFVRAALPLQQINLINPDGFFVSIKRDYDPESYGCFSRCNYDYEDCKNLACQGICASGRFQITRH